MGLANGVQCTYEQLVLPPSMTPMERQHLQLRIDNTQPGEVVDLDFTPHLILVQVPMDIARTAYPEKFGYKFDKRGSSVVVPVDISPYPTYYDDGEAIHVKPDALRGISSGRIGHTTFRVEPFMASTFYKIQGLTVKKIIVQLNHRYSSKLDYNQLYVGLSRVKTFANLRLAPLHPGENLVWLKDLKESPAYTLFKASLDADGKFSVAKCRQHAFGHKTERPVKASRAASKLQPAAKGAAASTSELMPMPSPAKKRKVSRKVPDKSTSNDAAKDRPLPPKGATAATIAAVAAVAATAPTTTGVAAAAAAPAAAAIPLRVRHQTAIADTLTVMRQVDKRTYDSMLPRRLQERNAEDVELRTRFENLRSTNFLRHLFCRNNDPGILRCLQWSDAMTVNTCPIDIFFFNLSMIMATSPTILTHIQRLAAGELVPLNPGAGFSFDLAESRAIAVALLRNHELCLAGKPEAGRLYIVSLLLDLQKLRRVPPLGQPICIWGNLTDMSLSLLYRMDRAFCQPMFESKFVCNNPMCPFADGSDTRHLPCNVGGFVKADKTFAEELQQSLSSQIQEHACPVADARHSMRVIRLQEVQAQECQGMAILSSRRLSLPLILPVLLHESWTFADVPNRVYLDGEDSMDQAEYVLAAVHLYDRTAHYTGILHFEGDGVSTPGVQIFCDPHSGRRTRQIAMADVYDYDPVVAMFVRRNSDRALPSGIHPGTPPAAAVIAATAASDAASASSDALPKRLVARPSRFSSVLDPEEDAKAAADMKKAIEDAMDDTDLHTPITLPTDGLRGRAPGFDDDQNEDFMHDSGTRPPPPHFAFCFAPRPGERRLRSKALRPPGYQTCDYSGLVSESTKFNITSLRELVPEELPVLRPGSILLASDHIDRDRMHLGYVISIGDSATSRDDFFLPVRWSGIGVLKRHDTIFLVWEHNPDTGQASFVRFTWATDLGVDFLVQQGTLPGKHSTGRDIQVAEHRAFRKTLQGDPVLAPFVLP